MKACQRSIVPFLFILCFISEVSAQIEFEKGYIVDSTNHRLECFIRNVGWKDSPKTFEYKYDSDAAVLVGDVKSINEFGVYGYSSYLKATVKIDRSSDELSKLSFQRNPDWSEETLFLKVLVNGKANLLAYNEGNFQRFFYQSIDTLEQLIYKKYLTSDKRSHPHNEYLTTENKTAINASYKQQLWLYTRSCKGFSEETLRNVRYSKNDLIKYFVKFNACIGSKAVDQNDGKNKIQFDLKILFGLNYTSASVQDFVNLGFDKNRSVNFDSKSGLSAGFETEFILPYNRNKWSLFIGGN